MSNETVWLGMDGGGTRLVALAVASNSDVPIRCEAGPTNLRLLSDAELVARFREVQRLVPNPTAIGIGLAGLMTLDDGARVSAALQSVWPGVPAEITHDLETAWWAAEPSLKFRGKPLPSDGRIIILSGTGSCCYGRSTTGKVGKVGGWGHWLGDRGSAYALVECGLRETISALDQTGRWGELGARVLGRLLLNDPADLIGWVQAASKTEVAALAPEVFAAAAVGDTAAKTAVGQARNHLVSDAIAVGRRLGPKLKAFDFVGSGSVLLAQQDFAASIGRALRLALPQSRFRCQDREAVWGAVELARRLHPTSQPLTRIIRPAREVPPVAVSIPTSAMPAPTEGVDERFRHLDRLSIQDALALMLSEEAGVASAVTAQTRPISNLVRRVAKAWASGGRLFYVGAGTSGRLGVLDASECPPTFRSPPEWVQGIIAGGPRAVTTAVEGAEDDVAAGAAAVVGRGVSSRDVVVGIAASGRTPFVWGALEEARRQGATVALVCCHPGLRFVKGSKPDIVIAMPTGPEVLAGSTRLKAGTATKLVLNSVTTLAMVQLGKVAGNLMVDLNPSNQKLRDRAVRIVTTLSGASTEAAELALSATTWKISDAAQCLGWKPPVRRARNRK